MFSEIKVSAQSVVKCAIALAVGSTICLATQMTAKKSPSLVLDFPNEKISVKLAGVVVREYPVTADSAQIAQLAESTKESQQGMTAHKIIDFHLIEASKAIPSLELEIIAEESGIGAEQLQKYIPKELVLITDNDLRIEITTDGDGGETYFRARTEDLFQRLYSWITSGSSISVQLAAEDAMSLFGVVKNGTELTLKF